jgi:hypothetical protein
MQNILEIFKNSKKLFVGDKLMLQTLPTQPSSQVSFAEVAESGT